MTYDIGDTSQEEMEIAIKVLEFWIDGNPAPKEKELLENAHTVLKYYYFREYEYFDQYEN